MTDTRQRFLIVRLSSIGDIVHTLPAVSALGRTFSTAEIHWVVERRHALRLPRIPRFGFADHDAMADRTIGSVDPTTR